jgi:hypothetical protein
MTGLDVYTSQQAIYDYLVGEIAPLEVLDAEIPDSETVHLVNGVLKPYVVIRFSDTLKASGQASFGGPTKDGYYSLVQTLSVAPTGLKALELAGKVNRKMIGYQPTTNDGPIEKDFGGGSYGIKGVNSKPSFFVAIAAFRFLTNLQPE